MQETSFRGAIFYTWNADLLKMVREKQKDAAYLPCQVQSYRSPGNLISALDSYESIQLSLTSQACPPPTCNPKSG